MGRSGVGKLEWRPARMQPPIQGLVCRAKQGRVTSLERVQLHRQQSCGHWGVPGHLQGLKGGAFLRIATSREARTETVASVVAAVAPSTVALHGCCGFKLRQLLGDSSFRRLEVLTPLPRYIARVSDFASFSHIASASWQALRYRKPVFFVFPDCRSHLQWVNHGHSFLRAWRLHTRSVCWAECKMA